MYDEGVIYMARTVLDKELQELDEQILRLGSLVDDALAKALDSLETGDIAKAGLVIEADAGIDILRAAIEEHTIRLLTLQQPLGGRDVRYHLVRHDLMAMLAGARAIPALQNDAHILQRATYLLWIAHKLERVADHSGNICERIVFILEGETSIKRSQE